MFFKALVLFSLIASVSMAADTAAEIAAANARAKAASNIRDMSNSVTAENKAYESALDTWGSVLSRYTKSAWTNVTNSTGNVVRDARTALANVTALTPEAEQSNNTANANMTQANMSEIARAAERAEAAREKARGTLGKAWDSSIASMADGIGAAVSTGSAIKATARAEATNAMMESYIRLGGLQHNFNRLDDGFKDLNNAMNYLERSMDRSVMAGYLQQKVARLLSSNSLCKAAASCDAKGNNKAKFNFNDLQDIFPNNDTISKGMKGTKPAGVK